MTSNLLSIRPPSAAAERESRASPVDLLLAALQRYHLRYQTDAKDTKTEASTREAFEINYLEPLFLAPRLSRS